MKPNEQDVGPYPIGELLVIWSKIARTADALYAVHAVSRPSLELKQLVDATHELGDQVVDHQDITRTLRVLAAQDGMHAGDWLRMKAAEASLPRRKPPPAVDLQLRLRGLNCKRLVARLIKGETEDEEGYRVTIVTVRGDVASVESSSFANALEGAIKMAGARREEDDE